MTRILLVEDNVNIAEALKFSLEKEGYGITVANNIKEAKAFAYSESFGLCLLDVTLPDGDGFDFYKTEDLGSKMPVVFLTARDDEDDVVNGLDMGAEDYITKPFSTKELLVRVKKIIIRNSSNSIMKVENVSYDTDKMELKKNGQKVSLSTLELKIVHLLFMNHDKAVSRDEVIDCIYMATGNDVYDHTVTVYLKRIRQKLGEDIIKTVKGIGYRIDLN